jgi:hypothetical protein
MCDDAAATRDGAPTRDGLSVRYNEDLDPNEGPGFGCFVTQAILFAVILLLIPVGLFAFNWPVWLLATLLVFDLILLFFVSMTSVFLLRVFFADRRRGRGRATGVARPTRTISTGSQPEDVADE